MARTKGNTTTGRFATKKPQSVPKYAHIQWVGEDGAYNIQESNTVLSEDIVVGQTYTVRWAPYGGKGKGSYQGKIIRLAGKYDLKKNVV